MINALFQNNARSSRTHNCFIATLKRACRVALICMKYEVI
jgi:hypothetical protein